MLRVIFLDRVVLEPDTSPRPILSHVTYCFWEQSDTFYIVNNIINIVSFKTYFFSRQIYKRLFL